MEVVATAVGFHGGRLRNAGDRFEVADGRKAKWFKPVEPEKLEAVPEEPEKPKRGRPRKSEGKDPPPEPES